MIILMVFLLLVRKMRPNTKLVLSGRDLNPATGFVNHPVYRGSTILAPDLQSWEALKKEQAEGKIGVSMYGRFGTPAHHSLQQAIAELEGGYASLLYPSGLAAISSVLLSYLSCGDHVLISDSAYSPSVQLLKGTLSRYGVTATSYAPNATAEEIDKLFRPETKVLFVESPGSETLEIQDIPALALVAKGHGAKVIMDNTWGTPLYFQPFAHGVDVSIQAATKYITGHSDCLLGIATSNEESWAALRDTSYELGQTAGPDDVFLALRGLRTMGVRLQHHWKSSVKIAKWLEARPEVEAVFHPALESHAGHAIWKRDFTGACGLFSIALYPIGQDALEAFIDNLQLFGLGVSWGGFESLALPFYPSRQVSHWSYDGPGVRIHIGLEDSDDLIADLEQAFTCMQEKEQRSLHLEEIG